MGKPLGGLLDETATQTPEASGGFFSNLMNSLSGKGPLLSLMADQVGQKLDPTNSNIFGGLGTDLAKSQMAGEALAGDKNQETDLLMQVLRELKSSSGMNNAKFARDPETGNIKVDTQTNIPKRIDEALPTEKSVSASNPTQKSETRVGSMSDMLEAFK